MLYAALHKICIYNWVPRKNSTALTRDQAELIYKVGKSLDFNFGKLAFACITRATSKTIGSNTLPFPSLIYHLLTSNGLNTSKEELVEEVNTLEFVKTIQASEMVKDLPYKPSKGKHVASTSTVAKKKKKIADSESSNSFEALMKDVEHGTKLTIEEDNVANSTSEAGSSSPSSQHVDASTSKKADKGKATMDVDEDEDNDILDIPLDPQEL